LQRQVEEAITTLQQAIQLNPENYRALAVNSPEFDLLRQDERFQALIAE